MDKTVVPHYEGDPASFSTIFTDEEYCSLEESECDSYSAAVLGYINQMLMEEDLEENYNMFQDSLALLQAEKSFYDVLGHNYPPPPPPSIPQQSPAQSLSGSSSDSSFSSCSGTTTGSTSSCDTTTSNLELDPTDYNYNNPFVFPTTFPIPPNFVSQSKSTPISQSSTSYFNTTNTEVGLDSNLLQFERGVERAGTMFLPNHNPTFFPSFTNAPRVVIKTESPEEEEEDEVQYIGSRVCVDDSELSELFDKVLLLGKGEHVPSTSSVRRRQGNYDELVDLRTLLMLCAQAISSENRSTANQILNQIKQHSSPTGDGAQRLAHFFGNALEARLAGTGSQIHRVLSSKRNSAKDMIRAYQVYSSACPFEKLAIIFANNSIWNNLAKKVMETLHIIDFGVGYGFKWPAFIHRLSKRPGGPPKLRITGIEHPYPVQRVHETGRTLASYCDRFNVPFEFNAIAQSRWENIGVEDLKIKKNEFVAVNCLFRFENLLDETVVLGNPRDAVLDLIKRAKPDIFVHGIVNGCYGAPFFVTRFREALFHYSALFDMLDTANTNTNVAAREDPMRLMFEEEIWGREVMNIIACEGCERVQRPETYRQWQLRHMRGGFRQLPMDHQIINKLKGRLREDKYDGNFMLEVDGNWLLQGWKGRILYASSCWVPP